MRNWVCIGMGVGVLAALTSGCTSLQGGGETWQSLYGEPDGSTGGSGGATGAGGAGGTGGTPEAAPPVPKEWACLEPGSVIPPLPPPEGGVPKAVSYNVPIFDFSRPPSLIPGLVAKVCSVTDPGCSPAVTMAANDGGAMVVQGAPVYQFNVPYTNQLIFFLRMTAPDYLDTEYYFEAPLLGGRDGSFTPDGSIAIMSGLYIAAIKAADADTFVDSIGNPRDDKKGILAVRTIDCLGNRAPGVHLNLLKPADGQPFTIIGGVPTFNVDQQPTDDRGVAGFANMPIPGNLLTVTVEGISPTGRTYGRTTVTIRPHQLTTAEIRPGNTLFGR